MDLSRFEEVLFYRRGQSQRTGTLWTCHFLLTARSRWQTCRLEQALATLFT